MSTTLLIVDDDPAIHDLIRAMLKPSEWRLEFALSGAEALSRLTAHTYDLIVTDILMPGMDGLELLKAIRGIQPDSKVVVMTVKNSPAHIIGSLRGQAVGYIAKPFTRDLLLDTIRNALIHRPEPDDIEVLSDQPKWISVRVRCKLATADRLTQFFRELPADLEREQRESISAAFRELLMNAIEHGGHLDPEQRVELSYVRTERSIIYYIRDPGEGFSFDQLPHAAISNTPGDPFSHTEMRKQMGIRPGGFGILLTKNFADELLYSSKGNEVVLVKHL
jgi:CheY-like chemotaxis protein/anti-sigma regulatory factor (Ser/Thr protein kinase)